LVVTFGDSQSEAALTEVTAVTLDASGSTGGALVYDIDFGDGSPHATSPRATHVYTTTGAFTATARIVDARGRSAEISQPVEVLPGIERASVTVEAPVSFPWFLNSFLNPQTGRSESRVLNFSLLRNGTLKGVYKHPDAWWSSFSGTIASDHAIDMALDDGTIRFRGSLTLSVCNDGGCFGKILTLAIEGGSADGHVLRFTEHDPY
jgi:hypothetical protein